MWLIAIIARQQRLTETLARDVSSLSHNIDKFMPAFLASDIAPSLFSLSTFHPFP
jgi:hypothetical protein